MPKEEKEQTTRNLLDDIAAPTNEILTENKPRKEKKYISFLPKMYWFLYRKPKYLLLFIPSFLNGWTWIVGNLTVGGIVDAVNQPNAMELLHKNSMYNFFAAIACAILTFINDYGWVNVGSLIGIKAKRVLFQAMMTKDVEFFDEHPYGDLLTIFADDCGRLERYFGVLLVEKMDLIGQLISSLLLGFRLEWRLTLLIILAAFVMAFISKMLRESARIQLFAGRKANAKSLTIAEEDISNIKTVYAYNRQEEEANRFFEWIDKNYQFTSKADILFDLAWYIWNFLDYGTVCVCLNIGAYFIVKGTMTPGNLVSLSWCAFDIGMQIGQLLGTLGLDQKALESADKIFEIVDYQSKVEFDEGRTLPEFQGIVEFQNVWFKYPTRNSWVLKNVSFKIDAGQIVAFVGHSGCGKSTIVSLLLRFYDVTSGKILLDNVDIKELNPRWLHNVISVVQQDPILFSMSVKENVTYGIAKPETITDDAINRVLELSNSAKFVSKLPEKAKTYIGEKGSSLSGGQKQRIAIARALLRNPTILLTDEATSALDAQSERKVQTALDEIMKGRTSVIIAHRLGTIRAAEIIYVIDMGEIVEQGTHEELLALKGHYFQLIERQLEKSEQ